jgi:hypothetical protein
MSYTDIYNQDPSLFSIGKPSVDNGSNVGGLSMGMPTVNPGAAISNLGQNNAPAGFSISPQPPIPTPTVPGVTPPAGAKPGFFSEFGPGQFALGAIQTLGSLWNSFQQNKLAKQSFNFQKQAYETNLANQTKTYNTELEDRIRSRYEGMEGDRTTNDAKANDYIAKNRL